MAPLVHLIYEMVRGYPLQSKAAYHQAEQTINDRGLKTCFDPVQTQKNAKRGTRTSQGDNDMNWKVFNERKDSKY